MTRPLSSRFAAMILGSAVCMVALIVGTAFFAGHEFHARALAGVAQQASRFIGGAQAALNRTVLGVDVLLAGAGEMIPRIAELADRDVRRRTSRLMDIGVDQNPLVQQLFLVAQDGRVLVSSGERRRGDGGGGGGGGGAKVWLPEDFLRATLAEPISSLRIGVPVTSPSSARPVLYFARSLWSPDGERVVAVAEVDIGLLMNVLVQGADINGLEVTLEHESGALLASVPAYVVPKNPVPAQPFDAQRGSAVDEMRLARLSGVPAIVVARPSLQTKVLVTASIPLSFALADWRRERNFIVGIAIVLVLATLLGALFLHRGIRRQLAVRIERARSRATLHQALESMQVGFVLLDAKERMLVWNRSFLEIFPWAAEMSGPQRPFQTIREHAAQYPRRQIAGNPDEAEMRLPDGRVIRFTKNRTPEGGLVCIYQDMTQADLAARHIQQLAFYDVLTGLPNRRLLLDLMDGAVRIEAGSGQYGALLFLDLDNFKTLNDALGHAMGDVLLREAATRIGSHVRPGDVVARLGGDEFVVMLEGLGEGPEIARDQASAVGRRVIAALDKPFELDTATTYHRTCSLGIALFDGSERSIEELLKQADIAMYVAKTAGGNELRFFEPAMQAAVAARSALENELDAALVAREFILHYQGQFDGAGRVFGAEALVRWRHPQKGIVMPGDFIGVAEDTELIVPLGLQVLEMACAQLAAWHEVPTRSRLQVAVNVSARQFRRADFVEEVTRVVVASGADPALLKLELTESLLQSQVQETIEKMQRLKLIGIRFSMDDFGIGYSSLSYLTQLPLDQLKIDRYFVGGIGRDPKIELIVETIVGMARNLGVELIAEGVETREQQTFLEAQGCMLFQGYLFGRPLAADEFERMLDVANAPGVA
ncbi:MAG: bifunctional diguanylate cyclase/phosphodiesterase [Janthinobacterium lividum]